MGPETGAGAFSWDQARFIFDVIGWLIGGGAGVYVFMLRRRNAERKSYQDALDKLESEVDEIRMTVNTASLADIKKLADNYSEIRVDTATTKTKVEGLEKQLNGWGRQLDLIQQHLLGNKS